jgi:hypothetical protein
MHRMPSPVIGARAVRDTRPFAGWFAPRTFSSASPRRKRELHSSSMHGGNHLDRAIITRLRPHAMVGREKNDTPARCAVAGRARAAAERSPTPRRAGPTRHRAPPTQRPRHARAAHLPARRPGLRRPRFRRPRPACPTRAPQLGGTAPPT